MVNKDKKIIFYSLLDSCPFAIEQDCNFTDARNMGYLQKLEWANSLSEQEIEQLVDWHYECYNKRMQGVD